MKLGVGRFDWDPTLERLIGVVRLALAAFALFIVWVDPTQPSKHVGIAYAAFIVYLVYSAAAFQLVRTRPRPWLLVTTQIIDLLWIPPVLLFTEAGNTPFFPFFVVIMLTAGIRWGIWASWAVTAYSLVVYGFLLFVEPPTPLDMNNDLMQLSYFLIVGILGGYLAEYRRRREAELRTLRATSEAVGTKYTAATAMVVVVVRIWNDAQGARRRTQLPRPLSSRSRNADSSPCPGMAGHVPDLRSERPRADAGRAPLLSGGSARRLCPVHCSGSPERRPGQDRVLVRPPNPPIGGGADDRVAVAIRDGGIPDRLLPWLGRVPYRKGKDV